VVKALRYYWEGPGIDSQWCHWEFFPWYPRQNHVSTQPLKVNTRDFPWGKGGRCVWLTTYHTCSAETSRKSGALTYPEPLGQSRPVAGNLYFTLLTYSTEKSLWEANWFSATQEIPHILCNPKVHYRIHKCTPPVPIQSFTPGPMLSVWTFRNKIRFYGEELLAPRPSPQAGVPLHIGSPRLFIQYIRSYPP